MDLDTLLHRFPLAGSPLSLLIRVADPDACHGIVGQAVRLLAPRQRRDEIVILAPTEAATTLPARRDGVRLRIVARDDFASGVAWSEMLEQCRGPVIVTADAEELPTPGVLGKLLAALDACDLVVGRRKGVSGLLSWPLGRAARWLFAVPLSDPLCSVKAIRKPAVAGIVLQASHPLVEFELVAKMTYLTSLMEEVAVDSRRQGPSLGGALLANLGEAWTLLWRPRFWKLDADHPLFRPPLGAPLYIPPSVTIPRPAAMGKGLPPQSQRSAWHPTFPRRSLAPTRSLAMSGSRRR